MRERDDTHPVPICAGSHFVDAALSASQQAVLQAAFREDPDLERELCVGMDALTAAAARHEFIDCLVRHLPRARRPAGAVLPALRQYAAEGRPGKNHAAAAPTSVED